MRKNQVSELFISFFLVILLLCSCAPSRTPSEGGKQAREGKPKSSQAETEEKLPDYLQKLIENLMSLQQFLWQQIMAQAIWWPLILLLAN